VIKRQGHEADHSPSTTTEVKETWIYTSTPPHVFMAWCLISYAQEPIIIVVVVVVDRLCGLVVRIPGYRIRGPGTIPGATTFPE
jgi:hypothetical protein